MNFKTKSIELKGKSFSVDTYIHTHTYRHTYKTPTGYVIPTRRLYYLGLYRSPIIKPWVNSPNFRYSGGRRRGLRCKESLTSLVRNRERKPSRVVTDVLGIRFD